jgi:HEAT repeat protein
MATPSKDKIIARLSAISPMPDDERLTPELLEEHEAIMRDVRANLDEDFIDPLIQSFGYGFAFEAYWPIVHMLESLPSGRVHNSLVKALQSGPAGPRMWSAEMLGTHRDKRDLPLLIKALDDPLPWVRASAVQSLQKIGDKAAVHAIEKLQTRETDIEVLSFIRSALDDLKRL